MRVRELFEDRGELIERLMYVLGRVSYSFDQRDRYLSELYHMLRGKSFDFRIADREYRIGRIQRIRDISVLKEGGPFRVSFYSNMVVPHFIVDGNIRERIEGLIRSGVGGIVSGYDDPSGTEVLSRYHAIAYEVPSNIVDIRLSIADVIRNVGMEERYKRLYMKAIREAEVLAINRDFRDYVIDSSHILGYCRRRDGYAVVSDTMENW